MTMLEHDPAGAAAHVPVIPKIVSVDDHVIEPAHLWQTWLPERFRQEGPRIERHRIGNLTYVGGATGFVFDIDPTDGSGEVADIWYYEGKRFPHKRPTAAAGLPPEEITLRSITYEQMRPG